MEMYTKIVQPGLIWARAGCCILEEEVARVKKTSIFQNYISTFGKKLAPALAKWLILNDGKRLNPLVGEFCIF